ncbi:MAG: hypothetical protein ACI8WB_000754 [Phenylobacterium sp.]|jgi:hypothetical protein
MDELQIYQNEDGSIALDVAVHSDSIWLYQQQMADLFDTPADNISLRLKNIYTQGELNENVTTEDFSVVRKNTNRRL